MPHYTGNLTLAELCLVQSVCTPQIAVRPDSTRLSPCQILHGSAGTHTPQTISSRHQLSLLRALNASSDVESICSLFACINRQPGLVDQQRQLAWLTHANKHCPQISI